MADPYRTSGGNYYSADGGYVGGATYKFDQLGRIISGIGPNGEPLDANGRIVGGNGSIAGGGAAAGAGTTSAQTAADKAERARQEALAFGSLAQGAGYFGSPLGQQTQAAIGRTLAGQDVPYTQGVQDRLFSQQVDANAGAYAAQDDLIRRSMAERGMEGSGAALAAQLGAGCDYSAANTQALSQIQNTAQLENWGAQERARAQGESFLASRSQAEAPYRLKEADLRSGWESIRDQVGAGIASGGLGAAFGVGGAPRNAVSQGTSMGFQSMPGQGGVQGGGFQFGNAQQPGYAQQARQAQQAKGVSSGKPGVMTPNAGYSYVGNGGGTGVLNFGPTQQPQQSRQPFNIGMW